MARKTSMEALEQKISKAQEQVSKTKKQHDSAVKVLSDLLDKRDAMRGEELLRAVANSKRTYEDILNYVNSDPEED